MREAFTCCGEPSRQECFCNRHARADTQLHTPLAVGLPRPGLKILGGFEDLSGVVGENKTERCRHRPARPTFQEIGVHVGLQLDNGPARVGLSNPDLSRPSSQTALIDDGDEELERFQTGPLPLDIRHISIICPDAK